MIGPTLLQWYSGIPWSDSLILADKLEEEDDNLCEVIRDCHYLNRIYNEKNLHTISLCDKSEILVGFTVKTRYAPPLFLFLKNSGLSVLHVPLFGSKWKRYDFSVRQLLTQLSADDYVRRKHAVQRLETG